MSNLLHLPSRNILFTTWLVFTSASCNQDDLAALPEPPANDAIGTPNIFVQPTQHTYSTININHQESLVLTVGNTGDAELTVANVVITGTRPGGFQILNDSISGRTLAPNEVSQGLTVAFLPTETIDYSATLEIHSNDPDENPLRIPLAGAGYSRGPIALCHVSPSSLTLPGGTATWNGAASSDPDGLPLVSYRWELSGRPTGSNAALPGCQNDAVCAGFAPDVAGMYTATLTVENTAGLTASCRADLTVLEQDFPPLASCDVDPPSIDLLTPQPATWIGSGSSDPSGDPLAGFSWTLQARPTGSSAAMPVCNNAADCGPFMPDFPGAYTGRLMVTSSNGQRRDCTATLHVTQTGQGPVAVCEVTPSTVHPPFESATFDGSSSYDPDGYPIVRHTWIMTSRPAGSAVSLPVCGNSATCGPFAPDIAGIYSGRLTIESSIGMTASCTVDLDSIPRQDLWVEMYWTYPGDDMDLHVVRPGGTLRSSGDCYYMNCVGGGLDWGQVGLGTDNPSLDLDDIPGTGPENVNINSPAPGVYTVVVHDYPGSTYMPANDVTINVYIDGSIVHTDTRTLVGENSDELFCTIDWPSGVVTPL